MLELATPSLCSHVAIQGKYIEAERDYARALEIRKTELGDEHPKVAASLNNLARLYDSQVMDLQLSILTFVKSWRRCSRR